MRYFIDFDWGEVSKSGNITAQIKKITPMEIMDACVNIIHLLVIVFKVSPIFYLIYYTINIKFM